MNKVTLSLLEMLVAAKNEPNNLFLKKTGATVDHPKSQVLVEFDSADLRPVTFMGFS